jgi:hypothetical protein
MRTAGPSTPAVRRGLALVAVPVIALGAVGLLAPTEPTSAAWRSQATATLPALTLVPSPVTTAQSPSQLEDRADQRPVAPEGQAGPAAPGTSAPGTTPTEVPALEEVPPPGEVPAPAAVPDTSTGTDATSPTAARGAAVTEGTPPVGADAPGPPGPTWSEVTP